MKANRVLETCLYAEDLQQAEEFYRRVLGLEAFARQEGRHVFFRCGESVFLLFNPAKTSADENLQHGAVGEGHVAFHMRPDEVEAWKAHLQAHHVPIESEHTWPNGGLSLYFRDPAGNCLELVTALTWASKRTFSQTTENRKIDFEIT